MLYKFIKFYCLYCDSLSEEFLLSFTNFCKAFLRMDDHNFLTKVVANIKDLYGWRTVDGMNKLIYLGEIYA